MIYAHDYFSTDCEKAVCVDGVKIAFVPEMIVEGSKAAQLGLIDYLLGQEKNLSVYDKASIIAMEGLMAAHLSIPNTASSRHFGRLLVEKDPKLMDIGVCGINKLKEPNNATALAMAMTDVADSLYNNYLMGFIGEIDPIEVVYEKRIDRHYFVVVVPQGFLSDVSQSPGALLDKRLELIQAIMRSSLISGMGISDLYRLDPAGICKAYLQTLQAMSLAA